MMEDKERAEKLAAMRKKAQALKAKKEKKEKKVQEDVDTPTLPDKASTESEIADTADSPSIPTSDSNPGPEEAVLSPTSEGAPPSLAEQSKLRSSSFRKGSVTSPLSPTIPEGEAVTEIYRKHVARIEELERENKRLEKERGEAEKRAERVEEQLDALRDEDDGKTDTNKLREENEALQRQIKQLQTQVSRRHGSSTSISLSGPPPAILQEQLTSKTATIESMEAELSKLQAQLDRSSVLDTTDKEALATLQSKLSAAESAESELATLKKTLDTAAAEAASDDANRSSGETKIAVLEAQLAQATAGRVEAEKKIEALDKKVVALTTLHKEQDARVQSLRRQKEKAEERAEGAEGELLRVREQRGSEGGGGLDDEGVDELLNEDREKLERRIRELEAEVSELRRGIWRDRRKSLAVGGEGGFQEVDLGVGGPGIGHARKLTATGGLGEFLASGFNALAGTGGSGGGAQGGLVGDEDDSFLSDEDGDLGFDEGAFRRAREEEAKARIERVKDLKRSLKNWEGWRLDLIDIRKGVQGLGDVFEV